MNGNARRRRAAFTRTAAALLSLLVFSAQAPGAQPGGNPVKIYIMLGQSNMVGHGNWYVTNSDPPEILPELTDPGRPYPLTQAQVDTYTAPRDDVWVEHQGENSDNKPPGPLEPGFGGNWEQIGVELAMGHALGNAYTNQFLLYKYDVGGTTLGFNWRPPSAVAARGGAVGPLYIKAIRGFHVMLSDLTGERHLPDYNGQGYEIAGIVWLQGWNEYFNDAFIAEYRQNLVDLVHDIRADVGVPDLPAIIVDCPRDPTNAAHESIAAAKAAAVADLNAERPGSAVYVNSLGVGVPGTGFFHWNYLANNYVEMGNRIGAAAPALMRADPPNHDGDPAVHAARGAFLDRYSRQVHYALNEGAGTVVSNSGWFGSGADAVLTNGTAWTGIGLGPGSTDSIDARIAYAESANEDIADIDNNFHTVTAWVRLAPGLPDVAAKYVAMSSGSDKGWNFGVKREQVGGQWKNVLFYHLRYRAEMEALNDTQGRPDLVLEENKPYFIAFVRKLGLDSTAKDNTMLYLFDPATGTLMANDGNHYMVQKAWTFGQLRLGIGCNTSNVIDPATAFPGLIDDARVWDLSLDENDLVQLATIGQLYEAPAAPFEIVGARIQGDAVVLTWSSVTGLTYTVSGTAAAGGPYSALATNIPGGATSTTFTNALAPGATGFLRVERE